MGTRATIQFSVDDDEQYFVYRGHDGFPENIMPDIEKTIAHIKGRWSEPELSLLVTSFLGLMYEQNKGQRLPDYEITPCFHGDESYRYFVAWNRKTKSWDVSHS